MKRSLIIATVLVFLFVAIYAILILDKNAEKKKKIEGNQFNQSSDEVSNKDLKSSDDALAQTKAARDEFRKVQMTAEYEKLVQGRNKLKSRANFLKSKIWGQKLPSEQAMLINKRMLQAYDYLKNPPNLGAYFELGEIKNEFKKVELMQQGFEEIERILNSGQQHPD
ncbi:MAG: hypothetical protein ACI9SC_002392 [Gammaproteobacteria bacterium]|jgi:hypothetical protein